MHLQVASCSQTFVSSIEQNRRSPKSKKSNLCVKHRATQLVLLFINFSLLVQSCHAQNSTGSSELVSTQVPDMLTNGSENHVEKQKVLHTIKKVLENYSDDAIRKIFASTETAPVMNEELTPVEFATTSTTESAPTTNDHKFHDALEDKLREEDANSITTTLKPRNSGMMRIRAGISRSSSTSSSQQQPDERPLNRQYRSARHDWLQHHRRKKGCPPMHGRDQLLCPTRNTRKYDVCISREQLCDHVVDCPGGEDESVEQCFFYKPLDDQLKTLSHAVLLLVDSIMADSQQRKQEL